MDWSSQQEAALRAVEKWYREEARQGKLVFRLFGFAGTGKSTLIRELSDRLARRPEFCAYTGKAAQVMRAKGCRDAGTIHQLIYQPKEKSRQRLKELEAKLLMATNDAERALLQQRLREEREALSQPAFALNLESRIRLADLIFLDEGSMVDARVGQDLLSFEIPTVVVGDPGQLPPVRGSGFFTSQEPDVMLTEIHRQAWDNPIIRMATKVREGEKLEIGAYGASEVIDRRLSPDEALGHNQILCGMNKTRRAMNERIRKLQGHESPVPEPEDRLVCLRNNHQEGLLNGTLWNVTDVGDVGEDRITMTVRSDDTDSELTVEAHRAPFEGRELGIWERREANEFDFGYALTVHKAQGSQWSSVLLYNQASVFRADAKRWLYTGITRASERITIATT